MARDFANTAVDNLITSTVPGGLTGEPFTMACWFNADGVAQNDVLIHMGTAASGDHRWAVLARGGRAGDPVTAQVRTTAGTNVDTTTGFSVNTWHHACGVFTSSTSRTAYIDGGSSASDTTSRVVNAPNELIIGMRTTDANVFDGSIAEVGIWNVALTAADVAVLATRASPLFVRPDALVAYWPLIGRTSPEIDLIAGNDLTVNGTTVVPHTAMFYPSHPPIILTPAAAAAAVSINLVMAPYIPA